MPNPFTPIIKGMKITFGHLLQKTGYAHVSRGAPQGC